jgi:hypothetical protein
MNHARVAATGLRIAYRRVGTAGELYTIILWFLGVVQA